MGDFSAITFDDEEEDDEGGTVAETPGTNRLRQTGQLNVTGSSTMDGHSRRERSLSGGAADTSRDGNRGKDGAGQDNPAYRPFDRLPYTDFAQAGPGETPIFNTGNHLMFPRTAIHVPADTRGTHAEYRGNTFSRRNPYMASYGSQRKNNSKKHNYYYYPYGYNYSNGSATFSKHRGRRLGPHHKYATTRHTPILAYSNNNPHLILPNGDVRKSKTLGRSYIRSISQYNSSDYPDGSFPIIHDRDIILKDSALTDGGIGGIDNPALEHPFPLANGILPNSRWHRNDERQKEEDRAAAKEKSRRTSRSTSHGEGAVINFRRHGIVSNSKESCVAFFDIETDKVSSYMYRPGEEVTGSISLIIRNSIEIRFVELVVTGRGYVVYRPQGSREGDVTGGLARTLRETYLYKRTYVIGSGDQSWSSLLTPGHYSSKFRVRLPPGLPSTIHHHDVSNGLSVEVTYNMKARICDDPGPGTSTRSSRTRISGRSQRSVRDTALVRVLMAKLIKFNVQRGFDISTFPEAAVPITHTEKVYLSCAHRDAAVVNVNLDRSVFLAGDDVKMQLATSLPHGQRVKEISCCMQEHVTLDPNREPITIQLSRSFRRDPGGSVRRSADRGQSENDAFEVTIPTQTDLVSPFSLGNSKAKVEYSLAIGLKFSPAGGKLAFKLPLTIGPCAEPIYAEKTTSRKTVPVFNRPIRFPHFSSPITSQPRAQSARPIHIEEGGNSSPVVQSKYSNSCLSRFLLCCAATTE